MSEATYPGGELELFAHVRHWKTYWASQLRGYIDGAVLEVGAGIGSNTVLLRTGREQRWVCLEPDPNLVRRLRHTIEGSSACSNSEVFTGVIDSLGAGQTFDTILYIDVLEHIPGDDREVAAAADRLRPGGHIIALSPSHPWLYSAFDRAIGHCRRYTRKSLAQLTPPNLKIERHFYLDAVGMLASAANRLMLRQSLPTAKQLAFWDNWMVPCSRVIDPITCFRWGKSVACVWQRRN